MSILTKGDWVKYLTPFGTWELGEVLYKEDDCYFITPVNSFDTISRRKEFVRHVIIDDKEAQ